jgi:hypothetical protein
MTSRMAHFVLASEIKRESITSASSRDSERYNSKKEICCYEESADLLLLCEERVNPCEWWNALNLIFRASPYWL